MFDSLFENVVSAIERWEPSQNYSKEEQYRDDLLEFLREELNKSSPFSLGNDRVSVTAEHGRGLCDIGVNRKVGIELKNNLKSKSVVDRLVGQINTYKKEYNDVVIVPVGDTNSNSLELLKDHIADMSKGNEFNTK